MRKQKEAFEAKQKELKEKAAAEALTSRLEKNYDIENKVVNNPIIYR